MLEMMLAKRPTSAFIGTSGPGPKTLKYGTTEIGYFGVASATEMFGSAELANLLNLTAGVDPGVAGLYWFKFAYKGKVLYVPSRQLRSSISWNEIYAAGLVYGTKSNGLYPTAPAQYQYNPVTKQEGATTWAFVPRLMTGWPNPTYPGAGLDAYPESADSEWQQLLGRVCTYGNGTITEKWDAKSPDLISALSTMQAWTQETQATDVNKANSRGYVYNSYAIIGSGSTVKTYNGGADANWRPVLELLPMDVLLNPVSPVLETAPIPQPPSIIFPRQADGPSGGSAPLLNPVNLVASPWPTKQPVIIDPTFTGSALNPTNVRGSANVALNPFTVSAGPSQLVSEPANVVYSMVDLNTFSLSVTNNNWLADQFNVLHSLADLNPFTVSGVNVP